MSGTLDRQRRSERSSPLWGRDAEIRTVERFAGRVDGATGALLITGEPGIGKSSVWRRGVGAARCSSVRVLTTSCVEAEFEMPHAALEELLSEVLDEHGEGLPPPQRDGLDAAFRRRHIEVATDRRTVAAAVLTLLRRALDEGPVLLAVDDLHWIDPETHFCLSYAARRLTERRLALLLAGRHESPLWEPPPGPPVDMLVIPERTRTMRLGPLPGATIRAVVHEQLGVALPHDESQHLTAQTGGNPFYALQLARNLREPATVAATSGPAVLRTLVAGRLAQLDADVIDPTCLVAALGKVRPSTAARAFPRPRCERDTESALDSAVAAGLLELSEGRLSASHPLIGAALLASLPPFHRQRIHRRAAELAETAEARAHHLLQLHGEPAPGSSDAPAVTDDEFVAALDAAASAARGRGAASTAARFASRALRLVEARPTTSEAGAASEWSARRIAVAELHHRAGELEQSLAVLSDIDVSALDVELLERAGPLLAQTTHELRGKSAARSVIDAIAALPDEGRPRWRTDRRAALVSTLSADLQCGARGDRRATAAVAVEQTRRSSVDPSLRRRALGALAFAHLDAGGCLGDLLGQLDDATTTNPVDGHGGTDVHVELLRGMAHWCDGDIREAREIYAQILERHLAVGDTPAIAQAGAMVAYADITMGQPGTAEETLARIDDHLDQESLAWPTVVLSRGALHLVRGEHDALEAFLDEQATDAPRYARGWVQVVRLRGLLAAQRGEHEKAVTLLDEHARDAAAHGCGVPHWRLGSDTYLADAVIATEDWDRASTLAAQFATAARRRTAAGAVVLGQERRMRARVAAHRDADADHAVALALEAVALHERCAIPSEHGQSMAALAEIHAERGEHDAARRRRREAHALFVRIGHRWWAERTAETDALSRAERAVADLVGGGATNRAAADALHLSVRTVENHLRAVYRKLAIRSREELRQQRRTPEGAPPSDHGR